MSQQSTLLQRIDHLVYAVTDLRDGIGQIEDTLGIRATPGGQHPGAGTRNALIALGPTSYLEICGPDPEQPEPSRPRMFGIDDLTAPRLTTWAANATDLDTLVRDAARDGVTLGSVGSGSRRTPQGTLLSWRFTDPRTRIADGLVPFFIDWGRTPHPAASAARGAMLVDLRAAHPEPASVLRILSQLGLELPVAMDSISALAATINCPRGYVELR